MTIANRFNQKYIIDNITGCWEWIGSKDAEGYGVIWDNRIKNNARAHRISMEIFGKPIPKHLQALHQCDNKSCVNPAHIDIGTTQQNTQEAKQRGLLANMSNKRKTYIQSMSDEEFKGWTNKFNGKQGRALANLTTAKKWRQIEL
jgi:hypothetical protein